jgi:lipoprotein-anchoring transpeptidase ErfK/SrfK
MTVSRRHALLAIAYLATMPISASAEEMFAVRQADVEAVPYKFRKREVAFETAEPVGTIVVDTQKHFLYLITAEGRAIRYGIGVGRTGKRWTGEAVISRKAKWPSWTPTTEMLQRHENYQRWKDGMPPGPDNPMGARAIYLLNDGVDNQIRIHGTPEPEAIGKNTTSGCFRMLNIDVVDLYDRVDTGTRVVLMPRIANKRGSLFGSIE